MKIHIWTIVLVKIIFIILALLSMFDNSFRKYKQTVESVFFFLMAILLIYLFNPKYPHPLDTEERYLLFLFGIIIIATTKWRELINL